MNEEIKKQIQITNIVYLFLLGGQIIFASAVLFFKSGKEVRFLADFNHPFFYLLPVFTFGSFIIAIIAKSLRDKKLKSLDSAIDRVNHYRETLLLQAALVEGGGFFALVITLISLNNTPLLFFCISLLFYLWLYPTEKRFIKECDINTKKPLI